MSFPVLKMTCHSCGTQCGTRLGAPQPERVYDLHGRGRFPVLEADGWCATCASIQSVELIPTYDDISRELGRIRRLTGVRAPASRKKPLSDLEKARQALDHEFLASEPIWRAWAVRNRGRLGKCLVCQHEAVPLESARLQGEMRSFTHPGCGGEMRWLEAPGPVRFSWGRSTELRLTMFSADGCRQPIADVGARGAD
jgi:hypothetical protein